MWQKGVAARDSGRPISGRSVRVLPRGRAYEGYGQDEAEKSISLSELLAANCESGAPGAEVGSVGSAA